MSQITVGRRELLAGAAAAGVAASVAAFASAEAVKPAFAAETGSELPIMGYATPGRPFVPQGDYVPMEPNQPEEDPWATPNEESIAANFVEPSGLLAGKVAVVTGASSGIGREIARAYAREGAKVVGVARREERLAALSEESANYAGEIAGFVADLSDREQTKQAIAFAQELYGPVDILVNNAGQIGSYSAVGRLDEDNWDYLVELNLNAPIFATKAVIEDMVENGGGAIINIASVGGIAGYFGVDYHTTKAALIAMTRQVAFSYSGKNIRCNAILPGGVKTEIGTSMRNVDQECLQKCNEQGAKYITQAQPEEIAALALFLASDAAKNINGDEIKSDGGWTA